MIVRALKACMCLTAVAVLVVAQPGRQAADASGELPRLELPAADPAKYLEEHGAKHGTNVRNVMHIAPQGFHEVDVTRKGSWRTLSDGSCLWSFSVHSVGATSQVVVFSDLTLPYGGEFIVYSPTEPGSGTRCTHPDGCIRIRAEDIPARKLTTLAMQGDEVVLEYHHPATEPPEAGFAVRIASVMQGLEGGGSLLQAADLQRRRRRRRRLLDRSQAEGYTPGAGFNMAALQETTDITSPCTSSVLCDQGWDRLSDAVVDIYAIDLDLGALALCTGTIINAPMHAFYVLTADHCFVDKTKIDNFQNWVIIMRYEQKCNSSVAPPIKQVMQGVSLLYYDSLADILLLELSTIIPDKFNAVYLGYEAQDDAVPLRAIGIHHPNGNIKRISYANASGSIATDFVPYAFPSGEVQPTNETHFQVIWSKGVTAPGSSGSPLIDLDTGRVVGVLTGGLASCDTPRMPDYYGRLSASWANGLELFLSNVPTSENLDEVAENLNAHSNGGQIVVRSLNATTQPLHGPALGFFPVVLTLTPSQPNASFTYFLTDAMPFDNEIIFMRVSVRGRLAGNNFDATPYVKLSTDSDTFNSSDLYAYKRSINVAIEGLQSTVWTVGNLLRIQLLFSLTSSVDLDYMHLHTSKIIYISQVGSWKQFPAFNLNCTQLPCTRQYPGRNGSEPAPDTRNISNHLAVETSPQLAIFDFTPPETVLANLDVCLVDGILSGATISIYVNGRFSWTQSKDSFGDPNCLHFAAITAKQGNNYTVVVSDNDSLDAVLPIHTVYYFHMSGSGVFIEQPQYPQAAGPKKSQQQQVSFNRSQIVDADTATKAKRLALPPQAFLSI